jgi:hypothetical protein
VSNEPSSLDATIARLTLDTSPWLSCDACFEKLDEYVERDLRDPGHADEPMRRHLAGCPACAEEADSLAQLLLS